MSAASPFWTKNRDLARLIASEFYLPGQERQDVEQEALIALWQAARKYDPSRGANFRTFARLVIRRRLQQCVRDANRGTTRLLTDAARDIDALAIVDERRLPGILAALPTLTVLEREALAASLNGTYNSRDKRSDNALHRARQKLKRAA